MHQMFEEVLTLGLIQSTYESPLFVLQTIQRSINEGIRYQSIEIIAFQLHVREFVKKKNKQNSEIKINEPNPF